MNSLRTDDILGAMPRVRHMPKNLIRQRKVPSYFQTNLQPYNQNPIEYDQNASNIYSRQFVNSPPINFTNNDKNSYPFYARNSLSKQPKYVNYDMFNNSQNMNRMYLQSNPERQDSRNRAKSNEKLNYSGRYADIGSNSGQGKERSQENRQNSRENRQTYQQNNQIKQQRLPSPPLLQNTQNKLLISQSQQISPQSRGSKQSQNTAERKIFRGLGYNIIANHKFEYTFQNCYPHASSLQK